MRVSKLFITASFLTSILLAAPAFADNVTFIRATGPVVGGVYVAPYQLTDSAIQGGATIQVVCDDFRDEIVPGETWNAVTESFSSTGALSPGAMFGSTTNQTDYDTAVYLYSENLSGKADAAGMNFAIWGLFDPSVVGSSAYQSTDAASLLAGVTTSDLATFGNYSSFGIITPTGVGSTGTEPQEFIYTKTPEPSSLLLFSSGLIGLGFVKRKLRRS